MPETPSVMLDLGTQLPSFTLPDFTGRSVSDADFKDARALLVAFICKHCPFVKHIRSEFVRFANEYEARGLEVVAIASTGTASLGAGGGSRLGGGEASSSDFDDAPALLVVFICPHCPFMQHIRRELGRFSRDYGPRGLAMAGINSNDEAAYPDDGWDGMQAEAADGGYAFAYLRDESQAVAKAYRAACTPDFFLFDGDRRLAYRGEFDDSRPKNNVPVTGAELRAAADAVLAGRAVAVTQKPSIGCNIKWYPGNEPAYYRT